LRPLSAGNLRPRKIFSNRLTQPAPSECKWPELAFFCTAVGKLSTFYQFPSFAFSFLELIFSKKQPTCFRKASFVLNCSSQRRSDGLTGLNFEPKGAGKKFSNTSLSLNPLIE